jgi:hypothetical protein
VGDFNEIVDQTEEVGGLVWNGAQMEAFRYTLSECSLGDLGYRGSKYTWSNKREVGEFIKERLDRALANAGWCAQFPAIVTEVLAARSSDHRPLWICFKPPLLRSPKLFRFEASWNVSEECAKVIRQAWSEEGAGGTPRCSILRKLSQCQEAYPDGAPPNSAPSQGT